MSITQFEAADVERANATGLQPVVFVHGLWLLPSSWERWARLFEEAGYAALTPPAGAPLFQGAAANLNPWTEVKVDRKNPDRGPLLLISGDNDHTVPWAITNAEYKLQKKNPGVTEIVKVKGRGHALTIDSGWREVAKAALEFVRRFV
ncbi:MAG: hypothetical protein ACJ79A_18795 [Gemmatimonadaceae bacterium]